MAGSKRQMTMAKIAREQALREKRANKQRRKEERQAASPAPDDPQAEEATREPAPAVESHPAS